MSEENPAKTTRTVRVAWEIDIEIGADEEAARAAQQVWTEVFNRGPGQPTDEEACLFTVHEPDGRVLETDLSHESHAHLFPY